jgi:hypothetical protein
MNEINMSTDPDFIPVDDFLIRLQEMDGSLIQRNDEYIQFQLKDKLIRANISKDGLLDSQIFSRNP